MIKREKLARHPRTIWRIWTCDVTPTSRICAVVQNMDTLNCNRAFQNQNCVKFTNRFIYETDGKFINKILHFNSWNKLCCLSLESRKWNWAIIRSLHDSCIPLHFSHAEMIDRTISVLFFSMAVMILLIASSIAKLSADDGFHSRLSGLRGRPEVDTPGCR